MVVPVRKRSGARWFVLPSLTVLFTTDLKGSTELYSRMGDIVPVRHFVLRENFGATARW